MHTLDTLVARHGIEIDEHLDRQVTVPVNTGLQRQGDVIVVPDPKAKPATTPVPGEGVPVVRGEAGGNTHAIVADTLGVDAGDGVAHGGVYCDTRQASVTDLTLAVLTVDEGCVAYLAHPEHAYTGIGPGTYTLRRQREQADELRIVAD